MSKQLTTMDTGELIKKQTQNWIEELVVRWCRKIKKLATNIKNHDKNVSTVENSGHGREEKAFGNGSGCACWWMTRLSFYQRCNFSIDSWDCRCCWCCLERARSIVVLLLYSWKVWERKRVALCSLKMEPFTFDKRNLKKKSSCFVTKRSRGKQVIKKVDGQAIQNSTSERGFHDPTVQHKTTDRKCEWGTENRQGGQRPIRIGSWPQRWPI